MSRQIKQLKECPACGNMFYPRKNLQINCSRECGNKNRRVLYDKSCRICNKTFKPTQNNQKFCSQKCAGIAKSKYDQVDEYNQIDKRYYKMPWLATYCIQKKGQCAKYDNGFDIYNTEKGCWGNNYTGNCYVEPMESHKLILRTNFQDNIYRL